MRILSTDHTAAVARAALLALALSLAGCASTETAKPTASTKSAEPAKQAAPAKAAEAAPAAPVSTGIAAPSGDMGTIVFFRASKFAGAAVSFKVREGEQELGKLSSGNYFVAQVPPGAH